MNTMNSSKERVRKALNHENTDTIPVDFGSTAITGIHCRVVEALRKHYELTPKPVKIIESFQMLGEIDGELADVLGIDCEGVTGPRDFFDIDATHFQEQVTPWGQHVLLPTGLDMTQDAQGDVYVYAQGDKSYPPSAVMPNGCYFINAIERQQPIDESRLDPNDNLEEFSLLTDEGMTYYKERVEEAAKTGRAIVASFGGTALGDAAVVPGVGLKQPKGIRSVVEWYMSTVMRQDYIHQVFEKQTDLAIRNYSKLWDALGDKVDVVVTVVPTLAHKNRSFAHWTHLMNYGCLIIVG